LRTLQAARADPPGEAERRQYLTPDLLIRDDCGLQAPQAEDCYEIIAERHPRGSLLVPSNRPPADRLTLFPDPVRANSALDRLPHHAHPLVIKERPIANA
jgi:DNA replication protein DnaC